MSEYLKHDWFPAPLPRNVEFGARTWLYSTYAFRHYQSRRRKGLAVGSDTGIYNGTFFDLGPSGQVQIGNHCTLVGLIICSNGRVEIGDYALIAHEVVFADAFAATPFAADDEPTEPEPSISLSENVWVCARAVLLKGARLGEGAIIGAGAVVDFAVPPFSIVAGNPAKVVGDVRRRCPFGDS